MRRASYPNSCHSAISRLSGRFDTGEVADGRDRVVACYELACALGGDVVPLLEARLPEENDGGVRRHILHVLAGFQRKGTLSRALQHDPSAFARGTAATSLIQIEATRRVPTELLEDPLAQDAHVLEQVFAFAPIPWPEEQKAFVLRALAHTSESVRLAALDAAFRAGFAVEDVDALARWAASTQRNDVRIKVIQSLPTEALLDALPAGERGTDAVLDLIASLEFRCAFERLVRFADIPTLRRAELVLTLSEGHVPESFLLRVLDQSSGSYGRAAELAMDRFLAQGWQHSDQTQKHLASLEQARRLRSFALAVI